MRPTADTETIIKEITIEAPAARIFEALTDPSQRIKWWGANYITDPRMESDLRPGGKWQMMGTAWGKPFSISGEYRIVEPPTALAFTMLATWMPKPIETLVRFDLEEKTGSTVVRLTHSGLTVESRDYFRGWPEILAGLQAHAESGR
jgi:uncharacterized protein YndB with AHSA1/START domain